MNNTYEYNGQTFTLKPLTLSVMKSVMPLLARLRKLQHEYTNDIDMSDVNSRKQRIAELETAKKQLLDQQESNNTNDEIADKIKLLSDKIAAEKNELELNDSLQQKMKLFNECSALALYELISDIDIIKPAIEAILKCGVGSAAVPAINFDSPESLKFLLRILTDFFLLIPAIKEKLPV